MKCPHNPCQGQRGSREGPLRLQQEHYGRSPHRGSRGLSQLATRWWRDTYHVTTTRWCWRECVWLPLFPCPPSSGIRTLYAAPLCAVCVHYTYCEALSAVCTKSVHCILYSIYVLLCTQVVLHKMAGKGVSTDLGVIASKMRFSPAAPPEKSSCVNRKRLTTTHRKRLTQPQEALQNSGIQRKEILKKAF